MTAFIAALAQCPTCRRTTIEPDTTPSACLNCGGTGTIGVMLLDVEVKRLIHNWAVAIIDGDVSSGQYAKIITPDIK